MLTRDANGHIYIVPDVYEPGPAPIAPRRALRAALSAITILIVCIGLYLASH
jgi:hypothetical protein